ncbi:hypothetical protein OH77DRAFT_1230849 [Trametes cingulata]|nr:hypothetical protein OH77DRAFT_1230849 [Trametes cingulata]
MSRFQPYLISLPPEQTHFVRMVLEQCSTCRFMCMEGVTGGNMRYQHVHHFGCNSVYICLRTIAPRGMPNGCYQVILSSIHNEYFVIRRGVAIPVGHFPLSRSPEVIRF